MPVKRALPSVGEKTMTNPNCNAPGSAGRKRTRLNFTEPPQISPAPKAVAPEHSTASRDRSNSGVSIKKAKGPSNNTLINDFFSVATKSRAHSTVSCAVETRSQARLAAAAAVAAFAVSPLDDQEKWQHKCQELEQLVADRDEQLKAVANNQTIMHTALRQSVHRLEQELEEVNKAKDIHERRTVAVIEKLVRSDSARESKELRDTLAGNSARLGRIVYTRAGMRAVESWEDGYAFKNLRTRRTELEIRLKILEERHLEAHRATNDLEEKVSSGGDAGGLVVMDALAVMEAHESVDMHMEAAKRQEIVLAEEEQGLNDEKAKHIRAWKRLQSEEESRFRSRPKVSGITTFCGWGSTITTVFSNALFSHFPA